MMNAIRRRWPFFALLVALAVSAPVAAFALQPKATVPHEATEEQAAEEGEAGGYDQCKTDADCASGHCTLITHAADGDHKACEVPELNFMDRHRKEIPFLYVLINFAILAGIYVYFGKKPIADALKNRRASIAKEIEEAQRMRQEAEERAKVYQAKLEHLEEELATAKAALIEAGKGERERIIKEAEEKAARMQKDAEFLIEQEMKQIRQDLWKETVTVAVTAAEELLKKRITPADQERLAEDYLEDLAGRTRRPPTMPPAAPTSGGAS